MGGKAYFRSQILLLALAIGSNKILLASLE